MGEMVAVGGAHENMKSVTDAIRVAPMLETIHPPGTAALACACETFVWPRRRSPSSVSSALTPPSPSELHCGGPALVQKQS